MKKDINLLEGLNESQKKGNSQATTLVIAILVVALIGGMFFMYMSTTNANKDKQAEIAKLDQQIAMSPQIAIKQKEYDALKATYAQMAQEVLKDLNSGQTPAQQAKIQEKLFEIIYTNYILRLVPGYEFGVEETNNGNIVYPLQITSINVDDSGKLGISIKTKTKQDAYNFYYYLQGTLIPEMPNLDEVVLAPDKAAMTKDIVYVYRQTNPKPGEDKPKEEIEAYNKKIEELENEYQANLENYQLALEEYYQYVMQVKLYDLYRNEGEKITNNRKYFNIAEWPGSPAPGKPNEYSMDYTFMLSVDWEALAK